MSLKIYTEGQSLVPDNPKKKEIVFFHFPINFLETSYQPISSHWLIDAFCYWNYHTSKIIFTTQAERDDFMIHIYTQFTQDNGYGIRFINEYKLVIKRIDELDYIKREKKKTLVRGFWISNFIFFVQDYYYKKQREVRISELDLVVRIISSLYSMVQTKRDEVNITDCKPAYKWISVTHNNIIRRMFGYVKLADKNKCPDVDTKYLYGPDNQRSFFVKTTFPNLLNGLIGDQTLNFINRYPARMVRGGIKKRVYAYSRVLTIDDLEKIVTSKKIKELQTEVGVIET